MNTDEIDNIETLEAEEFLLNLTPLPMDYVFLDDEEDGDFLEYQSKEELEDKLTELLEDELIQTIQDETDERFSYLGVKTVVKNGAEVTSTPLSKSTIQFDEYLSQEEKDQLVSKWYPDLIHHMVNKYYTKNCPYEYDELFGEASTGFVKALNTYTSYNREDAVPFNNYACFIMDGVITNYLKRYNLHFGSFGNVLSTDFHCSKVDNATLGEVLTDSTQLSVEEQVIELSQADIVYELCDTMSSILSEKEEFFIKALFGVGGFQTMTVTQLSQYFHETKYTINKTVEHAMEKLRAYLETKGYKFEPPAT